MAATAEFLRRSARVNNLGNPPPLSLLPNQVRNVPVTWDNMRDWERKKLVRKNTKFNSAHAPYKQKIMIKAIRRPATPTMEEEARATRVARQKRKAYLLETGVELGPGEEVGFVPKVLTPPKKGVRWGVPLEIGDDEDLKRHSPSPAKKMMANNGKGLLANSKMAMDQFGNVVGVSPLEPGTEPVIIKKVLYKGESRS